MFKYYGLVVFQEHTSRIDGQIMEDLPYIAEYAKSGRASCKGCKNIINKEVLRMGIMVQSPHFDGKMPLWHHFDCFFRKKLLTSVGDIANFQSLRWEDQERIKNKVVGGNGDASSSTTTSDNTSGKKKSKKVKKSEASSNPVDSDLKEFSVEYAKSSRSSCQACSEKIQKNEVRISKMIHDDETAHRWGAHPGWYHVDCFVEKRSEIGYTEAADKLPGFSILSNEDKDILQEKITSTGKKRKQEVGKPAAKKLKVLTEEEKALADQNKLIFSFRDKLSRLSKKKLKYLLEYNKQGIPPGESRILDCLSDNMAFGAIEPCSECGTGQLRFKDGTYRCAGHLTEWTKCMHTTNTPKRKPFCVPEDLAEEYDFLSAYKYVKRDRVIPSVVEAPSAKKTANGAPRPLENFKIALVGDFEKSTEEITALVANLGGKVVNTVNSNVTCIISTQDEIDTKSKKIKSAEKHGVHVVSEKFLDDVKNGGAVLMMKQNLLSTWGGDPTSKVERLTEKSKSSKSKKETKSSTVKVTVEGPAAVHPESGLQEHARVYEKRGVVYDVVLNRCDISKGYNSYYKMQILVSKNRDCFYVFKIWGRIGTTVGNNKLDSFDTADEAIDEFEMHYLEKTGNKWKNRMNFVKHPGLYYPIEIDYGQDAEELQAARLKPGSNSSLAKAIQDLICLIFDVEAMKKAMVEFEIDLKKMPLGKLSKKQVDKAYAVLTELQQVIDGDKSPNKLLDASNRFYTIIPHDFGMKKPPLLDTEAAIKSKIEMLDSLLEIEFAYSLLKGKGKDNEDPIDKHYHQLNTDIEVLDKSTDEFARIKKYISNTHAKTHDQYSLHLEEVFKINRHGEYDKYKKFQSLHNKQLLWHGSRITNFAGILSQGLRIAPPEAPSTGYMFGKGIYFADMVSKSANYCYTSKFNSTGLLLLCEVALGDMYEKKTSEYITKLPANKHSTKGLGQTAPNPKETVTTSDGVEIPLGKPKDTKVSNTSLLYNEYIIYDVAQVNIKYLLKVDFKYKY